MSNVTSPAPVVNVSDDGQSAAIPCDNPTIIIATAEHGQTKCHERYRSTWIDFAESFQPAMTHTKKTKDACPIFVFAALDGPEYHDGYYYGVPRVGVRRVVENAFARFGLTIDFDNADTTFDEVVERVRAMGLTAVVHTSYSHNKTVSHRKTRKTKSGELQQESIEETLARVPKNLLPHIVGNEVRHLPWPKVHVVIPFAEAWQVPREPVCLTPQEMTDRAKKGIAPYTVSQAVKSLNKEAYHLFAHDFAATLSAIYDLSCADLTRVIILPAIRPPQGDEVVEYRYEFVRGRALDWQSYIERAAAGERAPTSPSVAKAVRRKQTPGKATGRKSSDTQAKGHSGAHNLTLKTTAAPDLPAGWNGRLLRDFELASALSQVVEVRGDKLYEGKIEIECPYDESHSNAGDPNDRACFAVDASRRDEDDLGHQWPLIYCMHAHCQGHSTRDFIAKLIADGKIPLDLFKDKRFRLPTLAGESGEDSHAALRAANEAWEARMKAL